MDSASTPAAGENISIHRKARGWSQTKLARHAGISTSYLTKIERGERAATRTWNPSAEAVARWNEAGLYQSEGEYGDGLAVIDRAITQYEPARPDDSDGLHVLGSLHLRGVVLASRAKDRAATATHMRAAYRLAEGMNRDVLKHNLTFGPGNTALYELASLIEFGYPAKAAETADPLIKEPPSGLEPSRIGRLCIDAARAHLAARHHEDAAQALHAAYEVSPEMAQVHPMAREVLRVLLISHQRSRPDLQSMARRSDLLADA